jgi:hypothetical protein
MFGVVRAAGKVEFLKIELDVEKLGYGFEAADALGHDLRADAIARDDGNLKGLGWTHSLGLEIQQVIDDKYQTMGQMMTQKKMMNLMKETWSMRGYPRPMS